MSDMLYQNNAPKQERSYGDRITITTSMITIWDDETGVQLKLSAMNSGFGIAIWLPVVSPSGGRKYPTENRFQTVLQSRKAVAFEKAIMETILPAYEKGEDAQVGVFTNSNNTTMIEVQVINGTFYLLMHRNCDSITKVPRDTIKFKFNSMEVFDKFDPANGTTHTVPIQADFFLFMKTLEAYNETIGGAIITHGSVVASFSNMEKFSSYIRAIADAVHAQLPADVNTDYSTSYISRNQAPTTSGGFSQQYTNNSPNAINAAYPPVVTSEVNSLTDLLD